jgi:putative hydrolase of the HAD superfamily
LAASGLNKRAVPIRAVIFDLGHTVWDFAPREDAYKLNILRMHERLVAWNDSDIPTPKQLGTTLGNATARWMKVWDSDVLEQATTDVLVSEALTDAGLSPPPDVVSDITSILFGREVDMPVVGPDTIATFDAFDSNGIAMGCVSNTILLEEGIGDALMRLGLLRYFRSVVASSSMGYKKPHASLFERALAELEIEPAAALFVGDRLVDDVSGAQAVGMRAVLTHQFRQEPLDGVDVQPDAVIERLAELPAAIAAIESGASYP